MKTKILMFGTLVLMLFSIHLMTVNAKAAGYNITYVMNGGKNAALNPSSISHNKSFTLKKPTRKGYYFAGWFLDAKFKKGITVIEKGTTADLTLYAKWIKKGLQTDNLKQLTNTNSKNVFMNLYVSAITNGSGKRTYIYHGQSYTFCDLSGYEKIVKECNNKGINVTMQINLDWDLGSYRYLIAEEARSKGHTLYTWNTALM